MCDYLSVVIPVLIGVGASMITSLVNKCFDYHLEKRRFDRSLIKVIFEHKIQVVDQAMRWCQEALDCFRLLKMGCEAFDAGKEEFAIARISIAAQQSDKLFKEASSRLYSVLLYYDFSAIEKEHNVKQVKQSVEEMNGVMNSIASVIGKCKSAEVNSEDYNLYKSELKNLFLSLSAALDNQIESISHIQSILRKDFTVIVKQ